MSHLATSSESATKPRARASWPLPEPTLAYFPNARFVSDRDLGAPVTPHQPGGGFVAQFDDTSSDSPAKGHGHIPVLLDRCVELLEPALTRSSSDGSGAVLLDATLGAGGHAERFLTEFPGLRQQVAPVASQGRPVPLPPARRPCPDGARDGRGGPAGPANRQCPQAGTPRT